MSDSDSPPKTEIKSKEDKEAEERKKQEEEKQKQIKFLPENFSINTASKIEWEEDGLIDLAQHSFPIGYEFDSLKYGRVKNFVRVHKNFLGKPEPLVRIKGKKSVGSPKEFNAVNVEWARKEYESMRECNHFCVKDLFTDDISFALKEGKNVILRKLNDYGIFDGNEDSIFALYNINSQALWDVKIESTREVTGRKFFGKKTITGIEHTGYRVDRGVESEGEERRNYTVYCDGIIPGSHHDPTYVYELALFLPVPSDIKLAVSERMLLLTHYVPQPLKDDIERLSKPPESKKRMMLQAFNKNYHEIYNAINSKTQIDSMTSFLYDASAKEKTLQKI